MKTPFLKYLLSTSILLVAAFFSVNWASAQGGEDLSGESIVVAGVRPPIIMVDDPDLKNIRIPSAVQTNELGAASATFIIDYVAAGGKDPWDEPCLTFPENAKTAFAAAAEIWANKIVSDVPIRISACWANLGSVSILGYSGGGTIHRDFSGAPLSNTWYGAALANALAGEDLAPSYYDMHITYNQNFAWYYGTDANPPSNQYDLVTVAAHEIAHGLEFGGSAFYDGGYGFLGYGDPPDPNEPPYYPFVYDTFIEKGATGSATKLTTYTDGTVALGTALTSNDLWFNGPNANAANGSVRVKIYAPSTWVDGSSYSHLDYATFASTEHNMMVYAIGSGSANHNPGAVTLGLFNDLGWAIIEPPVNDDFVDAITVISPDQDTRFTGGATTELSDPEIDQCGITGKGNGSVWYKYEPATDGAVAFDTNGSDFETFIVVWEGTKVDGLTFVTCGRGMTEAVVAFQTFTDDTYYIEVGKP